MWNNPIKWNDPDGRCPECRDNVKDPKDGQSYTSSGGAEYTFGKGDWTKQGGTLGEFTVTASQSKHERTMSNPVVQKMRENSERIKSETLPFARHMVRSTIDGAGYTGVGITAVGTLVTPFVPPLGFGLLAVGGTVSSASGLASAGMNLIEGNYGSAVIDAGMVGVGKAGTYGLKVLKNRQIINTTDETVLNSIYNSSMDIFGIGVVPAVKK
jgi:hypothetical protein